MIHLSYQEAYVLGLVSQLKDTTELSTASSLLLGLYASHFLDDLEAKEINIHEVGERSVEEYFSQSGEEMFNKNLFYPVLKKLMGSSLLEIKTERIFKRFSRVRLVRQAKENDVFLRNKFSTGLLRAARNDVSSVGEKKEAIAASLPAKNVIANASLRSGKQSSANNAFRRNSVFFKPKFNKNPCRENLTEFILDVLQRHKSLQKEQKLKRIIEIFNAQLLSFLHSFEKEKEKFEFRLFWPESIVPEVYDIGDLFDEGQYKKGHERDQYLLKKECDVLKLRKHQLHTKSCTHDFYGIGRFTKKKKENIPLDKRILLQQKTVKVTKKRYFHKKKEGHVKIEFATLTVRDEKWQTICIESPSLPTVLALSLLINPDHSEKLNYTAFINKFYSPL